MTITNRLRVGGNAANDEVLMSGPEHSSRVITNQSAIQPERWVVYRQCGDAFVFASVDTAIQRHAIHAALDESRTWGEFRRLLPAGEWQDIEHRLFLGEDEIEEEDRSNWEDDDAPFMAERVRGIDGTAYPIIGPEWLGDIHDYPNVLITAHNEMVAGFKHTVLWLIPLECGETVAGTLREWGYFVERTDFLEFS